MRSALLPLLLAVLLTDSCYKPAGTGQKLGSTARPIVMAFVPSVEAQKVVDNGGQLCALLSQRTGLSFTPLTATSYVGIVEAMAVDKVQVAWLPPLAYVYAHQRNGDRVLLKVVRHGSPTYRGEIVVRSDSPIKTIADLKGKKVAFPEPTSASGRLYPKALMLRSGIDPDRDCTPIFAGSHVAALTALMKGSADAACCFDDARENVKSAMPDIMAQTRVLAKTEDIPADCVAVGKALDAATAKRISDALTALASDPKGAAVLLDLYKVEGLVPASDADYEPVRKMASALGLNVAAEVKKQK